MEIVTVDHVLEVPKESKEIVDLLMGIMQDVRDAKGATEIIAGRIGDLTVAIEGFDKLSDEAKSEKLGELIAYAVDKLADAFGK